MEAIEILASNRAFASIKEEGRKEKEIRFRGSLESFVASQADNTKTDRAKTGAKRFHLLRINDPAKCFFSRYTCTGIRSYMQNAFERGFFFFCPFHFQRMIYTVDKFVSFRKSLIQHWYGKTLIDSIDPCCERYTWYNDRAIPRSKSHCSSSLTFLLLKGEGREEEE